MTVDVREIKTSQEFSALRDEWNDLLVRSDVETPFLRHEWLMTWWNHFAGDGRLCVLVGRTEGRLLLALPLMETVLRLGPFRLKALRSITNTHSFRSHLLLDSDRQDALAGLWAYLRRRDGWHAVMITDVPLDAGPHEDLLKHVRENGGLAGVWHAFESASIVPEGTWAQHEQRLAKSVRKRLRNQRNRLKRQGEVHLEVLTAPNDVAAALPEAFEIERRSWKRDHGSAIACREDLVGFYTDLARLAAERGWMRLAFLRVGQARVAFEYAIEYNRVLHSIKIGYDAENYRKFSVGRLLVMDSLARCFEQHLDEYDFVGPLTPAHAECKPRTRDIGWVFLYRKTLLARVHYAVKYILTPWLKRLARGVRRARQGGAGT